MLPLCKKRSGNHIYDTIMILLSFSGLSCYLAGFNSVILINTWWEVNDFSPKGSSECQ